VPKVCSIHCRLYPTFVRLSRTNFDWIGQRQIEKYEEWARLGEERGHRILTYDQSGTTGSWAVSAPPAGQALREPGQRVPAPDIVAASRLLSLIPSGFVL